jgi:hypothetical protein
MNRARIQEPHASELTRFRRARPRSLAMIARARAHMPDGAPMAWMASPSRRPAPTWPATSTPTLPCWPSFVRCRA